MTEMLDWLARSGERMTVVGVLIINLFVIIYGVQKRQRWWVPGWMMSDCEEREKRAQEKLDEYITRTQNRLDILEELEDRRSVRR